MGKTLVTLAVACAVGIAVGVLGAQHMLGARLADAEAERDTLADRNAQLEKDLKLAGTRLARLQTELERQQERTASTQEESDKSIHAARKKGRVVEEAPDSALLDVMEGLPDATDSARNNEDPRDEAEREERRAWRRDMAAQFRTNIHEFMDAQVAGTSDPVAKERLASMTEYADYIMDLMQEYRGAETDEERAEIREEIRVARDASRELQQSQRDYMLRDLASNYGITSEKKQTEFIAAMQDTMRNPLYTGGGLLGGRGPGSGMGGPGMGGFGGGFGGRDRAGFGGGGGGRGGGQPRR